VNTGKESALARSDVVGTVRCLSEVNKRGNSGSNSAAEDTTSSETMRPAGNKHRGFFDLNTSEQRINGEIKSVVPLSYIAVARSVTSSCNK
jgi:hypothetical protein